MMALLIACALGVAQGMRHALEPDHVTAVSTLVADQARWRRILAFAGLWGLGHALTLLVVGALLSAFRAKMPPGLADVFELVVAAMLVALGVRAVARAYQPRGPVQRDEHLHFGSWAFAAQPLGVGIVHGLAGSGALAALAIASFPTMGLGVLFIVLYGLGAAMGMVLLAGIAIVPLARAGRSARASTILLATAGVFSIALGAVWAWPIAHRLNAVLT